MGAYFNAALVAAPAEQKKLREAQRAWLVLRDQCMLKPKAEQDKANCAAKTYGEREAKLGEIIHKPAALQATHQPSWNMFNDVKTGFKMSYPSDWKIKRVGPRISFGDKVTIEIKLDLNCSQNWDKTVDGDSIKKDEVLGGKTFHSIRTPDYSMARRGEDVYDYLSFNGQCILVYYQLETVDRCRSDESAIQIAECNIEEFKKVQEDDVTKTVIHSIRFAPLKN